jgi:hypothetical protein
VLINGLILIATISVLLQTTRQFDPHCTDDKIQSRRSECTGHEWEHFWYYVDHSCFAIFGVEWLFRMCGSFYIGRARLYWRGPLSLRAPTVCCPSPHRFRLTTSITVLGAQTR